jgi:hypothetical protein
MRRLSAAEASGCCMMLWQVHALVNTIPGFRLQSSWAKPIAGGSAAMLASGL